MVEQRTLHPVPDASDGDLLRAFVAGDAESLGQIVERHDRLVWGVCRRVLGRSHDAEDAFQATFLVLARKARSIARRDLLSNWLYGVALRTALAARRSAARRRRRETRMADVSEPAVQSGFDEDLEHVLNEELAGLSAIYRLPVILCDLEGVTREEAARQLNCTVGTLAVRITRGRKKLAERLARRGITVPTALLAVSLAGSAANAALPPSLTATTIANVSAAVAGEGVTPSCVASLARQVLKAMFLTKFAVGSCIVAVVLAAWVAASESTPAGTQESPSVATEAPPTIEQILAARRNVQDKVQRLKITLRRDIPESRVVDARQIFAWDGQKRFFEEIRSRQGGTWDAPDSVSPEVRAKMEEIERSPFADRRAFDGDKLYLSTGDMGTVDRITGARNGSGGNFAIDYLSAIGWFIDDPTASDDVNAMMRKQGIFGRLETGQWTVASDALDGRPCIRVDGSLPGATNTFWLDSERGFALLQLEGTLISTGKVFSRAVHSDFVEIVDGVWLPKKVHAEEYVPPPGVTADRVVYDHEVIEFDVAPQAEGFFAIDFPAGTMLSERIDGNTAGEPSVVEEDSLQSERNPRTTPKVLSPQNWSPLLIDLIAVALLAALAGWSYRRRARTRNL